MNELNRGSDAAAIDIIPHFCGVESQIIYVTFRMLDKQYVMFHSAPTDALYDLYDCCPCDSDDVLCLSAHGGNAG